MKLFVGIRVTKIGHSYQRGDHLNVVARLMKYTYYTCKSIMDKYICVKHNLINLKLLCQFKLIKYN